MPTEVKDIAARLSKKGTFMQAVRQLTEELTTVYAGCGDEDRSHLFNACKRVFTLLCSRYTAVGFWRVGKDLFAAVVAATASEPLRVKSAKEWLERAAEEVSKGEEESKGSISEPARGRPEPDQAAAEGLAGRGAQELRTVLQDYVRDVEPNAFVGPRDVDVEQLLSLIQLQAGSDMEQSQGVCLPHGDREQLHSSV